jgi:hypothetical protein
VPAGVRWYADGYNSVSEQLLTQKYGRDILAECWDVVAGWQAGGP